MAPPSYKTIDKCRVCGSHSLDSILDLGKQYVASAFVGDQVAAELKVAYPLELVRCAAPGQCGLVQLRDSVRPSIMYRDYGYQSGITALMRANLQEIAQTAEDLVTLKPGDTVLDIGCNDGTLLCSYMTTPLDRVGIDPSTNVAAIARGKGLEVVNDYFSAKAFNTVRKDKKARVVTSIAMFYDLEDPCAFAKDVASILADDGLWVLELSYFPTMFKKRLFDTICHEHLEYYGLAQMDWIMKAAGLRVHRVAFNEVNGGSFRVFVRKNSFGPLPPEAAKQLQEVHDAEQRMGLRTKEAYTAFTKDIESLAHRLRQLLVSLQAAGKRVYVYGASTKGNTVLQHCRLSTTLIPKAADRNPEKWGKHTLGTSIPIISEAQARDEKPDYFLVLPWHFISEFVDRESAFLDRGGQFILPLPELEIIKKDKADGKIIRTRA